MTAQHLGDLGRSKAPVEATFGWFGATIRVNPDSSPELELTEFMQRAAAIDIDADIDADDPQQVNAALAGAGGALDAVTGLLKAQIHSDDWTLFWALAKQNRQDISDLMAVAMRLTEVVSGFPSGRPSASGAGRSRGKKKSRGGSHSRATRALRLVQGRPDLQTAIIQAQQHRDPQQWAVSG